MRSPPPFDVMSDAELSAGNCSMHCQHFRLPWRSEAHRQRRRERRADVVTVVVHGVPAPLLELLVVLAEDVAHFELGFQVRLEQRERLARHEIDAQSRSFVNIGQTRRA